MGNSSTSKDSDDNRTVDYAKTKLYASIDLIGKSLSAAALVILGVAGFLLQRSDERSHEIAESRKQLERQYVPMLRILSLLEVELEEDGQELARLRAPSDTRQIGTNLRFVASSVFVPDGDPMVSIRQPDHPQGQNVVRIQMPLRATALMYAEVLRIRANFHDLPDDSGWKLDLANASVVNERRGRQHVTPDSLPAWQTWLGSNTVSHTTFKHVPSEVNLQDLILATDDVIQVEYRR